MHQLGQLLVADRDVGAGQPVERRVAGGGQVAQRRGPEPVQHGRVGGRLDVEVDRRPGRPAPRRCADAVPCGPIRPAGRRAPRPGSPGEAAFQPRSTTQLDAGPGRQVAAPCRSGGTRSCPTVGPRRRRPGTAGRRRGERDGGRHGLARHVPGGHVEAGDHAVHRGPEPFRQESGEPIFDNGPVVMHATSLSILDLPSLSEKPRLASVVCRCGTRRRTGPACSGGSRCATPARVSVFRRTGSRVGNAPLRHPRDLRELGDWLVDRGIDPEQLTIHYADRRDSFLSGKTCPKRKIGRMLREIDHLPEDPPAMSATTVPRPVSEPGTMSHRRDPGGAQRAAARAVRRHDQLAPSCPPRCRSIIGELNGTQTQYTWVVTATLLDRDRDHPDLGQARRPVQQEAAGPDRHRDLRGRLAAIAGFAQNAGQLIAARAFQGIGVGGLQALVQIVIAAMIPPRERGRYNGYLGGVMAVATVGGPLLGGLIVDTSWLGWRWCFFVGVPIAVIALVAAADDAAPADRPARQREDRLPRRRR